MRTISYYANMKNKLWSAAKQTNNPKERVKYLTAFDLCDRMIGYLDKSYKAVAPKLLILVVIVNLAVIGTIVSGCVSNTVRGIGSVFEGIGKDTIRAMDGYENNR